jgi:hypothetical protein
MCAEATVAKATARSREERIVSEEDGFVSVRKRPWGRSLKIRGRSLQPQHESTRSNVNL